MHIFRRTTASLFFILPVCAAAWAGEAPLERIAFGSCNKAALPQPLWEQIAAQQPDLWIWLGDIIYGDTDDMDVLRRKYDHQVHRPDYQQFRKQVPRIIGTWDDHDYGRNDAGKEYPYRTESQQILLDFLDEPAGSARREREGVYASYTYGPAGRQVKVLLLDTRYHRDPPHTDGDVLGSRQWQWLEQQLAESDAQVHVIGSSIQVIAEQHRFEKWANFPSARQRLFELIREHRVPGVVFISGDRHIGELSKRPAAAGGYPLYDLTASGLTHSYDAFTEEANRYRVGEVMAGRHYGLLQLHWEALEPTVQFQLFDVKNRIVLDHTVPLAQLQPVISE